MIRAVGTARSAFATQNSVAAMSTLVSKPTFKAKYDNFINGKFTPPVKGQYFDNISPIDGKVFTKAARSDAADINLAIDAAHKAQKTWGKTPAAQRRSHLFRFSLYQK